TQVQSVSIRQVALNGLWRKLGRCGLSTPSSPIRMFLDFFCTTTSYRDEPNPTPGRHLRIFPMFEFETHGGMDALRALESELLEWLGFGPAASFVRKDYQETAKEYGVTEISGETELKIGEKDG